MQTQLRAAIVFGALIAAGSVTGSALAADMPLKAPPLPVWSWTGFYAGGNLGYGWAQDPTSLTDSTSTTLTRCNVCDTPTPVLIPLGTTVVTAAGTGNVDPNGILGGLQAGYNWQYNQIVYGLEADIQASGQRGSVTLCDTPGCPAGTGMATQTVKLPWFGTLRGRLGFVPSPRWLVYATGGLAVAEIQDSAGGANGVAVSVDTTRAGYAVGGGVETALTDRWSFKLEYLFMGFGTVNLGVTGAANTTTTGNCAFCAPPRILEIISTQTTSTVSTRIDDNVIRGGLNYHFN